MKIQLGHDRLTASTTGFTCYACRLYLSITAGYKDPETKFEYYTDKDVKSVASKLGWCRRQFSPIVNIWFCSNDCATQSRAAKELTEYWMVENPR